MENITDMQIGKAGEYLVCAELIMMGFIAYPSEQGLPYDIVLDYNGKLLKGQVKTTRGLRNVLQRKNPTKAYQFNIKRCGKKNRQQHTNDSVDFFALVALDTKQVGFILNEDVKQTMAFRPDILKGTYKDENTNRQTTGTYLSDLTLEKILCKLQTK
jgi:hypothetical protein